MSFSVTVVHIQPLSIHSINEIVDQGTPITVVRLNVEPVLAQLGRGILGVASAIVAMSLSGTPMRRNDEMSCARSSWGNVVVAIPIIGINESGNQETTFVVEVQGLQ